VARDRVLTNHHVIDGCNAITVRSADGRTLPATMPARVDVQRDLALLAVPNNPGPVLAFRSNLVRRGESVVTYGFPLAGLLAAGPTLTTGEVSALAGLANNEQHFQISAPVQQGNSGGPLLDRQGHVMGVIVSKLNAQRIAQRTGDIPQNVNFAVKGTEALGFLRRAGVETVPGTLEDVASWSAALAGCDTVIHAGGAIAARRRRDLLAVNGRAVGAVADACGRIETPPVLVHLSSLAAAGPAPASRPACGTCPMRSFQAPTAGCSTAKTLSASARRCRSTTSATCVWRLAESRCSWTLPRR
jgi:hypothetical protein